MNIFAESYEQPVQFMVRGDLKNMEYNLPPIIHMYRPFLMVVHLRSSLIFGSSKKSVCHFVFGLLTQISLMILFPRLYFIVSIVHIISFRWLAGVSTYT